jgi:putative ABC transport system permease protein
MIKNYFKIAVRNLRRNRIYSFINIGGLTVGLTCCLLIFYFINHEYSYDNFHNSADNIYRINTHLSNQAGEVTKFINTPPAFAAVVKEQFPEVEKSTRLRYAMRTLLQKDDHYFYETDGFYADSSFFDIFSFELKEGNQSSALDEPNSIVMTEAMAKKYFGELNPLGQLITMNNDVILSVTGILNPIPSNSHLQFDFLISFPTFRVPAGYVSDLSSMNWLGFLTYVKLVDNANYEVFENKLNQFNAERALPEQIVVKSQVQPLENIYLNANDLIDDLASNIQSGNKFSIYVLVTIAILILLIAGFNFINLTIAFSANRRKEVGVRKTLGADKSRLVFQMLNESILVVMISVVMAYALLLVILPHMTELFEWNMELKLEVFLSSIPLILLFAVLFGIVAGLYPSSVLSGMKTVTALKGKHHFGTGRGPVFRNILIILQFGISIGLIVSTIVVTKQINHLREQTLGFESENILVINLRSEDMTNHYDNFKNRLLQNSNVVNVSRSDRLMGDPWPSNPIFIDGQDRLEAIQINCNWVDYDYIETMGISLKEGRSFSDNFADDSLRAIIINEKAVEYLGLTNPVGARVNFFSFDGPRTIIGVVEDFNFSSLHYDISPVALILPFIDLENMYIRVSAGSISENINVIESSWEHIETGIPLEIRFMDDHLNQLYSMEEKLSYLISGFSILAVILACLGLYGLVAFMINNRTKEIGIRKVLGASVSSLTFIFIRQYLTIISIAALLSVPGTEYILSLWLDNFAYRVDVSWWMFALSGVIALLIALASVSVQAIKAATANPIESLRYE